MATLTIQFQGVCTHFWNNALHGIPHRVVLPDAGPLRAGLLTGPFITAPDEPGNWLPYLLFPHFAFVSMGDFQFTAPGLADDGYLFTNSHLRVVNSLDTGLVYDGTFPTVPQLTAFFPQYSPSDDVIMGGGAAAYFDILSGTFSALPSGDSIGVQAVIETDGPPILRITPMVTNDQPLPTQDFTLNDTSKPLIISNTSPVCPDGCDFDFLVHYLSAVGGIPRAMAVAPPGLLSGTNTLPNVPDLMASLEKLKGAGYPGKIQRWHDFFETSASCSDSRYP
jgi:hypothetical protein